MAAFITVFNAFMCYIHPYHFANVGRQQVMIGIVPVNVHHASSESCKSIYHIAILPVAKKVGEH